MVLRNDTPTAADYNSIANIVRNVYGLGTGVLGYGQTGITDALTHPRCRAGPPLSRFAGEGENVPQRSRSGDMSAR